ncbi:hypothetical protein FS837_001586 [Tulasnella sp. UAMH 9824]|nr:hypothetical protein FS837_001586 [Tulasnella sp. UAMH 9824]
MATIKKQHRPSVASIPISTSGSSTVTSPKVTRKGGFQQQQPPSSKTPTAGSKFAVPNGPTPAKQPPGEEDLSRLEPDQMFARFAVAEHSERYRDLLQASSAIVSISETSQKVQSTLEDIKDSCDTSKEVRSLKSGHKRVQSMAAFPSSRGRPALQDSQLVTLHSLAAHLKLLLDTPEQLWRLLERKKYLQAAWLYLLARVVHRALTQDDEDEQEVPWSREGIEIMEQFPLVQRQWDTISSFRSQISYRASQSLRDLPSPPPSTPAPSPNTSAAETLMSILLLDALPLSDTLSLFLSQRTKTLQAVYSSHRPLGAGDRSPAISKSRKKNQELAASLLRSPNQQSTPLSQAASPIDMAANPSFRLTGATPDPEMEKILAGRRRRDKALKQVRNSLRRSVDILAATLGAIREIYGGGSREKPLIEELLENAAAPSSLDSSTAVNTPTLLKSLPSSTLLIRYLPPSIQSYAPFIDTTSPSSQLSSSAVAAASSDWNRTSLRSLEDKVSEWLQDLDAISEVWSLWTGLLPSDSASDPWRETLTAVEREELLRTIQQACVKRVKELWKDKLAAIEASIVSHVKRCIEILQKQDDGKTEREYDINPPSFYFSPDFLDALSGMTKGAAPVLSSVETTSATLVQNCKNALHQRVLNRTPLLNSVLEAVESMAKELWDDLAALEGPLGQTRNVAEPLLASYRPEAQSSALEMVKSLQSLLSEFTSTPASPINARVSVFIGKVALILATDSSFVEYLVPDESGRHTFCSEMSSVHDSSLDIWRSYTVQTALQEYRPMLDHPITASSKPSTLSTDLSKALQTLATSIQQLGFARHTLSSKQVPKRLLEAFSAAVASEIPESAEGVTTQIIWDLLFLSRLCAVHQDRKHDSTLSTVLDLVKASIMSQVEDAEAFNTHLESTVDLQLSRSQLLLGLLLPTSRAVSALSVPPTPGLKGSRFKTGTSGLASQSLPPPAEKDFQLAMEIAKPSSRFGMLLVPSVDGRA